MATLIERLEKRFRGVPNVTASDITDWVNEAESESGFTKDGEGDDDHNNALLYLALSIGYNVISSGAAHYFKYSDGDESVDKTMIAEKYMTLSRQARKDYRKQLNNGYGASQTHAGRADDK